MKKFIFVIAAAALLAGSTAQAKGQPQGQGLTREQILDRIERTAGLYHSYEEPTEAYTPAPKGYEPFYISHFGRHGSRWHTSERLYAEMNEQLAEASAAGLLTAQGEELARKMAIIAADAEGRCGQLSPRGVREHRGIAERMYKAFPEVFSTAGGRRVDIECRSTVVPRCILSMAAFSERLKELNPQIEITRETGDRYMEYLNNMPYTTSIRKFTAPVFDSLLAAHTPEPERVFARVYAPAVADTVSTATARSFMVDLYLLASIMQDTEYLGLSLYDLLTEDECYDIWQFYNARAYLGIGPSPEYGRGVMSDMRGALRNIIESADAAIGGNGKSATLRFAHDVNVIPLASLLGLSDASATVEGYGDLHEKWCVSKVSPMAANIQIVFFRHKKTGEVIVKMMLNEREQSIPVHTDMAPYYRWEDVRPYLLSRLEIEP